MLRLLVVFSLATVSLSGYGMLNASPCNTGNVNTATCRDYIRGYTYQKLLTKGQEIHKNQNQSMGSHNSMKYQIAEHKDHIVFACHKAVSINNLVKKVQTKLNKNEKVSEDINDSIDSVLYQYVSCRKGFFGQSTTRK